MLRSKYRGHVPLPPEAKFEQSIGGNVVIWDVTHLLLVHGSKKFGNRPSPRILRQFVHHSGSLGNPGFAGMWSSSRFSTSEGTDGDKTVFPGFAYHFWISKDDLRDSQGRMVVLRGNHDMTRAWHTGATANDDGVGIVLQGNTSDSPMSASQKHRLKYLLEHNERRFGLKRDNGTSYHAEAVKYGARKNKPSCPGRDAEKYVRAWRSSPQQQSSGFLLAATAFALVGVTAYVVAKKAA